MLDNPEQVQALLLPLLTREEVPHFFVMHFCILLIAASKSWDEGRPYLRKLEMEYSLAMTATEDRKEMEKLGQIKEFIDLVNQEGERYFDKSAPLPDEEVSDKEGKSEDNIQQATQQ